jgi:hypothetical protein
MELPRVTFNMRFNNIIDCKEKELFACGCNKYKHGEPILSRSIVSN